MRESRGRTGEGGWTLMEVLLVVLFLGLLLAIVVPNLLTARVRNDEAAAVRTLRELVSAQEMIRGACIIDEDRDGRGEFAFLEEISGERNPRSFAPDRGIASPAPLPQFRHRGPGDGTAEICGYRFYLRLPGPGGTAVEGERADPALAAKFWCAYAWPLRREGTFPPPTGSRTLFANQAGEILFCDGDYATKPPGEGSPPRVPEPGAAFVGPGPMGSITGAPAVGTQGRDGNLWRLLK